MAAEIDNPGHLDLSLTVNLGSGDHEVAVLLPSTEDRPATGEDLYRLLTRRFGSVPLLTVERTGRLLARSSPLDRLSNGVGLLTGDRLVSIHEPDRGDSGADGVVVEFLTGPGRGNRVVLGSDVVIGRDTHPGFDTPSVSRHHCRLQVGASGLLVEDLGATNPTVVNGRALTPGYPTTVIPGDVVDVGHVTWRLVDLPEPVFDPTGRSRHYRAGRLLVGRAPRPLPGRPPLEHRLPDAPTRPPDRRFPLATAVVPLVMGAVMAVVFSPYFALFIAMSPLMVVWTFLDDRRSGRRQYQHEAAEYSSALARHRLVIADAHDQLAAWQRRRSPAPDQILRWVKAGARELWWRQPGHDDFLTVAVGMTDLPSELVVHHPTGGAPELVAVAADVATDHRLDLDTPLTVDLGRTPVVGITGPAADAVAVASSLVAQLVGLRSHRDLELAVIAPEHGRYWSWTGRLPHVMINGPGSVAADKGPIRLVAGDDDQARAVFDILERRLAQRLDQSAERLGGGRRLPHTVVVLQPPVGLSPAAVGRFLEQIPGHGFSVLYLAESVGDLPGTVGIHVDLTGSTLDQSATEPPPATVDAVASPTDDRWRRIDVEIMATGLVHRGVGAWTLEPDTVSTMARCLAPLVDVTAGAADGDVPDSITLTELLDDPRLASDPDLVAARWTADRPGLAAVIGQSRDGPLILDLKVDGPHGLVAGTTGAGKSEFLRTMLASLALSHAPTDVNFILIDYKGGAAFRQCRRLPHTVGFVTDLDDRLARRALISMRAELRRREEVLARAEVSDLAEMARRHRHTVDRDLVPASLLIVIDEFAALRTEVPDFVDGLVDVAQRGRSMGVHMILATQKPGGVITPQIEANTNIRIALRVATVGDSNDVIGTSDAADIPTELPGRALIKIGGADNITAFQAAYVAGSAGGDEPQAAIAGVPFGMVNESPMTVPLESPIEPPTESGSADPDLVGDRRTEPESDLDRIVTTVRRAWAEAGPTLTHRPLHRPWLPPLPPIVTIDRLDLEPVDRPEPVDTSLRASAAHPGPPAVIVGLADRPEQQRRHPYRLEMSGNVAVYGSSGSGKTTLLRTIAFQLARDSLASRIEPKAAGMPRPSPPVIYAVDAGGGLAMIDALPGVADMVAVGDHERLQRLLAMIRTEIDDRRSGLATAGAGSVSELDDPPPRWLVMIDGFASFWTTVDQFDFGRRADEFARTLSEANGVGISFVITADRRSAIPPSCLGAIGTRLLQRLASADEYRALDVRHPPPPERMPAGRTLVAGASASTVEIQVAVAAPGSTPGSVSGAEGDLEPAVPAASDPVTPARLDADVTTGTAQARAIETLARRLRTEGVPATATPVRALPDVVPIASVGQAHTPAAVPIGLDQQLRPLNLDLADHPTLLIVGGAGSGKSTALQTVLAQLDSVSDDIRLVAGKRSGPLADHPSTVAIGSDSGGQQLARLAEELAERIHSGTEGGGHRPVVLAIDDVDTFFDDATVSPALSSIVLHGRDAGAVILMTAPAFRTAHAYETWIRAMRSAGHGLILQPDGDKEEDIFDVRFPRGSALRFPPGRGYHVQRSTVVPVHVATIDAGR